MNLNGRLFIQLVLLVLLGVGFSVTTVSLSMADSPTSQPTIKDAGPSTDTALTPAPVYKATAKTPTGQVLRERSRLLDRQGVVVRTAARLQFVPADGAAPITLLENRMLERVEQLLRHAERSPTLQISGLVTEYHRRNYLLLTRVYVATPTQ